MNIASDNQLMVSKLPRMDFKRTAFLDAYFKQ